MPKRIFLSYSNKDKRLAERFRRQAAAYNLNFEFTDYPAVTSSGADWKSSVEKLIRSSVATICLVGDATYKSEPVSWEVRKAKELNKPILAFFLIDQPDRIPNYLREEGIISKCWRKKEIVSALKELET